MARTFYLAILALFVLGLTALADPITLTLTPSSGTVSGLPGDAVGWGYSIDNETTDSLIVANSYFCEPGQDPLFTTCTPALGTYSDFIANSGTFLSPDGTADQSFDAGSSSGVGEYTINSFATAGEVDTGSIVVLYDLFDSDFNQIGGTMELTAPVEVDVAGAVTTATPEPASVGLFAGGLLLLGALCRQICFSRSQCLARARRTMGNRQANC
jgi:hypothetical protein